MKILHAYCLNYNLGDHALGIGVKNLLREYLDVDLIAETNLQGTLFNEYFINEVVNKRYDLLVIGGGGIIHGGHWPNGWFWLIREQDIEKIKVPFIVYAAGYNYFENEGGMPAVGKSHLKRTIEKAAYFSVRNDGSAERLSEQIGVGVPVIPDPGFHINLNKTYHCVAQRPFVIVQLANDKPDHRFGDADKQRRFVDGMRTIVQEISMRCKVILAPHVHDDVLLSKEVARGIPNTEIWNFSKYAFDNCVESLGYYQNAEFVLAMRGHGQILPIAFNTPVISIENHPKHSGLMRELGLVDYNASVNSDNFVNEVRSKIQRLVENRATYVGKLISINAELAAKSNQAFEQIRQRI